MTASDTANTITFPRLNLEFVVDSNAFSIGGFEITWYGILITFGMILAMLFGFSLMKKYGIDSDRGIDCVIAGIVGGIIGARLYYVLMELDSYHSFIDVINIRKGGLAIYGGVIGSILFAAVTAKIRKVYFPALLDIVGMAFLIGQCIGRWGNFFNHEAFGDITDSVFGMTSPRIISWMETNTDIALASNVVTVHPCFLYESVWCLLGFLVLYFGFAKRRKFDGQIFLMYIIWYGAGRAVIEGLRLDSLMIGTIRVSQVLAILSCVTALVLLLVNLQRVKQLGTDYKLYCDTDESKELLALAEEKAKAVKEKKSLSKPEEADEAKAEEANEDKSEEAETKVDE